MWTRLSSEKTKQEVAARIKDLDAPYGVMRKSFDRVHVGLTDDSEADGTYSAAALIAEVAGDCVLVQKIGDDRYWLCCVIGGEVIPNGDSLTNSDGVLSQVDEFLAVPSFDDEDVLNVFANKDVCKETGIQANEFIDFEDIVSEVSDMKDKLNIVKIKKLNSNTKSIAIAGGVTVALVAGLGAWWYIGELEAQRQAEEYAQMLRDQQSKNKNVNVVSKEKIIQQAYFAELEDIDKIFNQRSGMFILPYFEDLIRRVDDTRKNGWKLLSIEFSTGKNFPEPIIKSTWQNDGNGTFQSFKGGVDADRHTIDGTGRTAIAKYNLTQNPYIYKDHYNQFIKVVNGYRNQMIDEFLELGLKFDVKTKRVTERLTSLVGIPETDPLSKNLSAPYTVNEITVKGSGIEQLLALKELLTKEKFGNLAINKIEAKVSKGLSWTLIGEVYEK